MRRRDYKFENIIAAHWDLAYKYPALSEDSITTLLRPYGVSVKVGHYWPEYVWLSKTIYLPFEANLIIPGLASLTPPPTIFVVLHELAHHLTPAPFHYPRPTHSYEWFVAFRKLLKRHHLPEAISILEASHG